MDPVGTPGQTAALPQIGHILGGKYEIVRLLGEGGMAFVFEASHQRLHQRVDALVDLAPGPAALLEDQAGALRKQCRRLRQQHRQVRRVGLAHAASSTLR